MDILIKSFNRPYYLDRCLASIYKHVTDSALIIKILDDGTPEKYLAKLTAKYPEIRIYKSDLYAEKASKIAGRESDYGIRTKSDIPIKLWIEAASNATGYFLLLEDDIWLTANLNLDTATAFLNDRKVPFLKLFWLGNPKLVNGSIVESNESYTIYKPRLYTKNPLLFWIVFRLDRFKIRKVLTFLGVYTKERLLDYYSIYSVAGVVFKKDYFLNLWNNHRDTVDEGLQLFNAVKFYNDNPGIQFARTNNEVAKTGFQSAATNQHKNYEGINLDVFALNSVLNEAWYRDDFDPMELFPMDLNSRTIGSLLEQKNQPHAQMLEWQKWVARFKKQFSSFGCETD